MKRTISKMLGITALAIAGIAGSFIATSPAQAATTVSTFTYGTGATAITCYGRWNDPAFWPNDGTAPQNAHYIYCGKEIATLPANPTQAQLQTLGITPLNAFLNLPAHVKTLFDDKTVTIIVFKDINQRFGAFGQTAPPELATQPSASDYISFPPVIYIYEQGLGSNPPQNEVTLNSRHEAGHQYQYFKVPGRLANSAYYKQLVARDFLYLDLKLPTNTYRGTYSYWLTNYTVAPRLGYEEMFSEQFALSPNLPASTPLSTKPVDPILRDYFKCGQAYVNAHYQRGTDPVKSDFTALNTAADPDVYSRCVLPYKPPVAACSYVPDTSLNYPWLKAETTFYVYCGSNPTRFKVRSGDILMTLPTATPTQWRQKFQYAGYALYVFQDSAQALSLLGAAAVPTTATAVGVLGFHQPQPVGNATTPFVAMFERVKQPNGTYLEHPGVPTVDLFNYDQGLYRETGRGIDRIAGTNGSASALFRNRITGDISRFNLKDGCAASGPDTNLWGSLKGTICNTTTHVKKGIYVGVPNIAIVRGLSVAQIGSGAVQFPPDYQAMFADVPTATNFSLIWAELIGFRRADIGNDFKGTHIWLTKVYPCGKLYTDAFYTTAAPIAATGACP
ncbi:MAG: hypothetical protein Q8T09_07200 [Candidatus Melainabacteria bacterium]|nr:hypothetical protein [Candidatus Melainabacteria bacterium]